MLFRSLAALVIVGVLASCRPAASSDAEASLSTEAHGGSPAVGEKPSPSAPVDRCSGYTAAVLPSAPIMYPTGTATEVLTGLATDASYLHTLEDIAGVRQNSNPLRDLTVPRCAVAELVAGDPVFVRGYPRTAGRWYVPVLFQGRQVLLVDVGRDDAGQGASGGSRGGQIPSIARTTALTATSTSSDPAVSVELVFARYGMRGHGDQIAWRAIRSSGSVVYLFPDFPGVSAPGLVVPEAEVDLGY